MASFVSNTSGPGPPSQGQTAANSTGQGGGGATSTTGAASSKPAGGTRNKVEHLVGDHAGSPSMTGGPAHPTTPTHASHAMPVTPTAGKRSNKFILIFSNDRERYVLAWTLFYNFSREAGEVKGVTSSFWF